MAKKKKDTMEFRFYEIPQGEAALVLYGESWARVYGHDEFHMHFHNLLEVGICRYGEGDMYLNNDVYRYKGGAITVIPENYPHVTVSSGEDLNFWEYFFIDLKGMVKELFPSNLLYQNEVIEAINKRAIMTDVIDSPGLEKIINAIIYEAKSGKPLHQKMIELYVQAFVLELMRRGGTMDIVEAVPTKDTNMAQIAAALDYINKNYEKQIRAGELADICNISETHFRRIFEEYINMAPMEYVNLIRIQKACEHMKKSNDSMDVVAAKCGFTTTSTFNRNFKRFLNTSPYQWKINPENYEHQLLNFRISALKGW